MSSIHDHESGQATLEKSSCERIKQSSHRFKVPVAILAFVLLATLSYLAPPNTPTGGNSVNTKLDKFCGQLAGHDGAFLASGRKGTVLKESNGNELKCFKEIMEDEHMRPFVAQYHGIEKRYDSKNKEKTYIELQNLLDGFTKPSSMDIKMGVRTYTENATLFKRICLRYRDTQSSTSTLGFRIEGFKTRSKIRKDFEKTKSEEQVRAALLDFVGDDRNRIRMYLNRLRSLSKALNKSEFFASHELIGSSLLFVHDDVNANIWMIDFAKTFPPPVKITHTAKWVQGNHEDGYLIGLNNLIRIFENLKVLNDIKGSRMSKSLNDLSNIQSKVKQTGWRLGRFGNFPNLKKNWNLATTTRRHRISQFFNIRDKPKARSAVIEHQDAKQVFVSSSSSAVVWIVVVGMLVLLAVIAGVVFYMMQSSANTSKANSNTGSKDVALEETFAAAVSTSSDGGMQVSSVDKF